MHRTSLALFAAAALCAQAAAQAQPAVEPTPLAKAFEAAWARQPEARALDARRDAADAGVRAARQWTPEAPALEIVHKTDRVARNEGVREWELGVALPLWLPGERSRSMALADAERAALGARTAAVRLRVAGELREAWWPWMRAQVEAALAHDQLASARALADDVARRLRAGDLARADAVQAEGAVAAAEAAVAQADQALAEARLRWQALTGAPPEAQQERPEPLPDALGAAPPHPALEELRQRMESAQRSAELARIQTRANPELTLSATRDRGSFEERPQNGLNVALRLPFGGGPRHDAKAAAALAEATEAEARLALETTRLAAEGEAARSRVAAQRMQRDAADRRARLAQESRGFFDKSFRLGETDLPTRLRIEREAMEAQRQAARSRIDLAAAISQWRQALGLLPQ
ncbi:MAG TPA: TolC family protein [Burkholderiaceae bacterium]|nr:TolC family protein [Burkholderiaceae bacterium]